ncbi:hypothetical protein BJL95_11430 [Methylomonas sp. LWB]|uniref:TonB-dependent receptor n=1 Tax=Methylomonas sp. LWB TaxID=1905845 RepID=UPI0008D92EBD|nr:TonB-dependent receptor [Methylomonas sp. LWB]OHX36368.1 hypothetical protein BJL95_11430 [Methylomonas sp. LWB]
MRKNNNEARDELTRQLAFCAVAVFLVGGASNPVRAADAEVVGDGSQASDVVESVTPKPKKSAAELDEDLDEVVISATKTATALVNAPAAVTVIGQKDMEARNVARLGDILTKTPSLYLGFPALGQTQGSSGSGNFSLRGANTQRTLVLIDGQPLQDGNSSSIDWRTVMTDDIEKVEVVPGAFSSLYGSSAIGGVINVLTKKPTKHELTIRGKKGFQDAEGEDTSIFFRERFANGLGVVAGFGYMDRDGYTNEYNVRPVTATAATVANPVVSGAVPTTNVQGAPAYIIGEKGRSPWTQMNGTAKFDYQITDNDKILAGWSFSDYAMGYTPFNSFLRNAAGLPVYSGNVNIDGHRIGLSQSQFVNSAPLYSATNRYFTNYEHKFGPGSALKANFAYIDREYSFSTVSTAATQFNGAGTLTDAPNAGLDADLQYNFPLHFNGLPFARDHVFVTGANLHRETVDRATFRLTNWRDPNSATTKTTGYIGETKIYSLYAQDEISVFEPLTVYLGGRMNWWETEGAFEQLTAPLTRATYPSRGTTNFSPKFSGVYKPLDELTLRASWGTSFRAPTNLDLYSTSVISSSTSQTGFLTTQSDPTLTPETATNWEFGGEWRMNPKVMVGATYYETLMKNLIYSKNVDLSLTQRVNAGAARIRGVELSFGTKPWDWLEFYSNYAYIDSNILANAADPSSVGKHLTSVPKHMVKAGFIATYRDWSGSMEFNHFSHQYVQSNNSDIADNVPGAPSEYSVVNAKLGYKINDMIKFNTAINNLTDEKYYQFYLMPGINLTTEIVLSF